MLYMIFSNQMRINNQDMSDTDNYNQDMADLDGYNQDISDPDG